MQGYDSFNGDVGNYGDGSGNVGVGGNGAAARAARACAAPDTNSAAHLKASRERCPLHFFMLKLLWLSAVHSWLRSRTGCHGERCRRSSCSIAYRSRERRSAAGTAARLAGAPQAAVPRLSENFVDSEAKTEAKRRNQQPCLRAAKYQRTVLARMCGVGTRDTRPALISTRPALISRLLKWLRTLRVRLECGYTRASQSQAPM